MLRLELTRPELTQSTMSHIILNGGWTSCSLVSTRFIQIIEIICHVRHPLWPVGIENVGGLIQYCVHCKLYTWHTLGSYKTHVQNNPLHLHPVFTNHTMYTNIDMPTHDTISMIFTRCPQTVCTLITKHPLTLNIHIKDTHNKTPKSLYIYSPCTHHRLSVTSAATNVSHDSWLQTSFCIWF